MRLIRDDAPERISHALTLLAMIRVTQAPEMREQHIQGIEITLELLLSSMKNSEPRGA